MNVTPTTYPEGTVQRRIIDYACQQFFLHGLRKVTMTDISKGLQMSKRTLYQLFKDKEELIIACIQLHSENQRILVQKLLAEQRNVLEIVLCVIEDNLKEMARITPQFHEDTERYSNVSAFVSKLRARSVKEGEEFLRQGVLQGVFRPDVNFRIVLTTIFNSIDLAKSPDFAPDVPITEFFINMGIFHLRGCCTEKGIQLIDLFLEHYRKGSSPV